MPGLVEQTPKDLLIVDALSAGYRSRSVLQDVSFRLASLDRVALIGANGCGKSTLLRCIMKLVSKTSGRIRFHDHSLESLQTHRIVEMGIGYLKQSDNVYQQLSVRDNLAIAANTRENGSLRREQVLDCFPIVRKKLDVRAGLLSGGQRQSLALAMVLLRPVSLLLLDEPLAGLSASAARELVETLRALHDQFSFASIIVEHRLRQIKPIVNRLLVMRSGMLIEDTTETQLMLDADWLDERYRFAHG